MRQRDNWYSMNMLHSEKRCALGLEWAGAEPQQLREKGVPASISDAGSRGSKRVAVEA